MENTTLPTPLLRAIAFFPTLRAFSEAVGVNYQVVQQWRANGVPAEYCPVIERLTAGQVRCEELNSRVDWSYVRQAEH